jgi:lactate dehydrogenase-like 2-hydroxyacid dehydrogenase
MRVLLWFPIDVDRPLINVGRGETVDEEAPTRALADGTIAGAALDAFVVEPPENLMGSVLAWTGVSRYRPGAAFVGSPPGHRAGAG